MTNYHAEWANSALRPTIFGVIDAYAGVPFVLLAFDLDNGKLFLLAISLLIVLSILKYFDFTPMACLRTLRRYLGKFFTASQRGRGVPFRLTILRLLT